MDVGRAGLEGFMAGYSLLETDMRFRPRNVTKRDRLKIGDRCIKSHEVTFMQVRTASKVGSMGRTLICGRIQESMEIKGVGGGHRNPDNELIVGRLTEQQNEFLWKPS